MLTAEANSLGFIDSFLLISFLSLIFYYVFRKKYRVIDTFKLEDFAEVKKTLNLKSPNIINETSNGFVSKMIKSGNLPFFLSPVDKKKFINILSSILKKKLR